MTRFSLNSSWTLMSGQSRSSASSNSASGSRVFTTALEMPYASYHNGGGTIRITMGLLRILRKSETRLRISD